MNDFARLPRGMRVVIAQMSWGSGLSMGDISRQVPRAMVQGRGGCRQIYRGVLKPLPRGVAQSHCKMLNLPGHHLGRLTWGGLGEIVQTKSCQGLGQLLEEILSHTFEELCKVLGRSLPISVSIVVRQP